MLNESRTFNLTRAGRAYLRFLNAYNTNDPTQLHDFISANFAPDFLQQTPVGTLVDWCLQAYQATGPMRIHKVYFTQEYYVIIVSLASDEMLYLEKLKIMDTPPHHIVEYMRENA